MSQDEFKQAILQTIAAVPAGKVASYGQIAKAAGFPGYARQVGQILKKLPKGTGIPWYRIINSQGRSSFPPDSDAYRLQLSKLADEGVEMLGNKINLKQFGNWPNAE